jgi:beta-mannosidase
MTDCALDGHRSRRRRGSRESTGGDRDILVLLVPPVLTSERLSQVLIAHSLRDWTLRVDEEGPSPLPPEASQLLGKGIAAVAPGAVHGDLRDAGLIPDPFLQDGEDAVAWVSRTDWIYEREVSVPTGHERVDLVFDGVDTVARVEMDGTEIGRSRNMHRSYRYDVTKFAGTGPHHLAVRLSSAYTEADAEQERLGKRPNAYPEPFNFIRKMACSFGWDWGPTIVGAGLWRPVRIEAWHTARIAGVRPLVDVDDGTGVLRVLVDLERAPIGRDLDLGIEILLEGVEVGHAVMPGRTDGAEVVARVPAVRVWNPVGYGSPELYGLSVRLVGAHGESLDLIERRIGFRRLELDRSGDEVGSQFVFRINGQPVMVKGANWIPDDVLPGRMTRRRYEHRLRQAQAANVNMIRVWGGGIYEDDDFYDVCDELGLLVWQDFLFACACYPEDEPVRSEVLAEARENVARLASHASLVLWNGNNENLWLYHAQGWAELEGGELPWGETYYLEDLPAIVEEVDPSRPYTAGSPWSGSWDHEPNEPEHQTFHSWDVWNREDYTHYRDSAPRFVSEFGWQAPPAWRTLRDAVSDDPITPSSPGVLRHQKAADGQGKLERGLAAHFPIPDDVDAWHYLTQLNQVRAVETGIMHWRSHWPHTAGTILWQLNDLWPVISWAAIDGAGRLKPLYHALRDLYAERTLTIQTADAGPELCVLNDSAAPWAGVTSVYRVGDHGPTRSMVQIPVEVGPRAVSRLPLPRSLTAFDDPAREVLVTELDGRRALWFPVEPRDAAFAGRDPQIEIRNSLDGLDITVTATTLLRDFLVQPDRMHPAATADSGFLTLLAGESATVRVVCPEPLQPDVAHVPYAVTWLDAVLAKGPPGDVG